PDPFCAIKHKRGQAPLIFISVSAYRLITVYFITVNEIKGGDETIGSLRGTIVFNRTIEQVLMHEWLFWFVSVLRLFLELLFE
ncbi:hypothetical protein ABDH65_07765, partial [Heyndrickxia ginsengihumi]|uniref:hypothetical protein n=1 Tax=Heyndrickxia ginsengihumi TaxID=363870 RepID=UPI003D2211E8